MKNNVKVANTDEGFVDWILKKTKTKKIKDILVTTLDANGKIYFQTKKGTGKVFQNEYKKENPVWKRQ